MSAQNSLLFWWKLAIEKAKRKGKQIGHSRIDPNKFRQAIIMYLNEENFYRELEKKDRN